MIFHLALGIETTCATARIGALLIDTGQMLGTLRADHALGSATRRSAKVANLAAAGWMPFYGTADTIRSTWIRFTHRDGSNWCTSAAHEGIALVAALADAAGQMIYHRALGIGSTSASTGIAAMLLDAGQRGGTLRVVDTFWPAARAVRIAKVGLNAAATCGLIMGRAHSILGTRIRVAWIDVILWIYQRRQTVNIKPLKSIYIYILLTLYNNLGAADEGIALVALIAAAVGRVSHNCATSIVAAGVGAWILALFLDACLVGRTFAA